MVNLRLTFHGKSKADILENPMLTFYGKAKADIIWQI